MKNTENVEAKLNAIRKRVNATGSDKGSINPDDINKRIEKMRASGELVKAVRSSGINYGLDENGRVVAEHPDGRREVGSFRDGKFIADSETTTNRAEKKKHPSPRAVEGQR